MGMSASQARLIALNARMNDIEYQGQQINQQRTTLSNQINALYNTLLEMDVPTPPSTQDFTRVVYTGTKGASKFTMSSVTPGTVKDTYNVDMQFTKTGHSWTTNSDVNVTQGQSFFKKVSADDLTKALQAQYTALNINNATEAKKSYDSLSEDQAKEDIYVRIKASDLLKLDEKAFKDLFGEHTAIFQAGEDGDLTRLDEDASTAAHDKNLLQTLGDKYVYVQLNKADLQSVQVPVDPQVPEGQKEEGNALINLLNEDNVDASVWEGVTEENRYMLNTAALSGYKIISSTNSVSNATEADFTINKMTGEVTVREGARVGIPCSSSIACNESGILNEAEYIATGKSTDDKVNGKDLIEASDLLNGIKDENKRKSYIQGLKNQFGDLWKSCNNNEALFLANFKGYTYQTDSGSNVYCMLLKSDIANSNGNSVPVYEYIANGTYTETTNEEGCKLEFDTDGRITKLGIPNDRGGWDYIDLTATEETDDKAYKDAFNKYEYEKYKYDQRQQEINIKTSVIQQEDKSLELKLTRLDNERNAVNTEIEAVKKVVNDDIQASFKTFSG